MTQWQNDYIGPLPSRKGEIFPFGKYMYLAMDCISPTHMLLSALPPGYLLDTLLSVGIPHNMAADQKVHCTAKAVTHGHETHWSYHVPCHTETAVLMKWCNGASKKQSITCWENNTAHACK